MIFQNADIFVNGHFRRMDLRIEENHIAQIGEKLSGQECVDLSGKKLIPGLVEVHSHGCIGYDFSLAKPEEIEKMRIYYQQHGITSVAATTMTLPVEQCREAMRSIHAASKQQQKGARLLGINMEGPFLSHAKKGAHDPRYLLPLDRSLFEELDQLSGHQIRIVDLDPDLEGAMDFIRDYGAEKTISIAHTACTYATAMEAFRTGAREVTHLYNAMNGLHHREPGVVGAVMDSEDARAELICDGIHVADPVIRLTFRAMGEKLILISDSMCACGLSDGVYELGGLRVDVQGKKATLTDGTIAGSVTNVFDCMVHAIGCGVSEEQAVFAATMNPACSVKAEKQVGSLEVGKLADFLVVSPDYQLEQVYQNGIRVR